MEGAGACFARLVVPLCSLESEQLDLTHILICPVATMCRTLLILRTCIRRVLVGL